MTRARLLSLRDVASTVIRRYGLFIVALSLITFGFFFILSQRDEIGEAIGLIASISPAWLVILALLQFATLLIGGWAYQVVLRRQGYEIGVLRLVEIHLRRVVIGAVTPVGGPASIYVLMRALRVYGVKDSETLIVASLKTIGGVLAFLLFLVPALLLQTPTTLVTIATAGLLFVLMGALWMSVVALRQGELPRLVQRWAPVAVLSFVHQARAHRLTARDLIMPTLLGFASHALTAVMLYAGLQAVGYSASISTVLIGYVVGKLFFMMAPVFQGIGIVEIGMVLALQQSGVPSAVAVSGALLYRVGDLWMPLSWGFIVQFARMPWRQHARDVSSQAAGLATGIAGVGRSASMAFSDQVAPLSRLALVTEAPLALMVGAIVILAGGLPSLG